MRILLTGGSGTVGREVLNILTQNHQNEIVAFDVNTRQSRAIYKKHLDKINVIYGDITKAGAIEKACENIDFVIHLAAIIPPLADEKPELTYRVNTIGTQNLISALEKKSPKAFLLFSSSVSVYGDRLEDYEIKVGDKLQASEGDKYAETKIKAEELIKKSKLNWSIFRLSAIIGIGNHKISGLMFHMPLQTKMEITTPKDTARAFVNSIGKEAELNHKIFNLGGGESCRLTFEDFLKKNFEIMGLGNMSIPPKAFAEKSFHCGYYVDGNNLEEILHFQKATLESHFSELKSSVSKLQYVATRLLSFPIQKYLTMLSEPLEAIKKKDELLIKRFFKTTK